jgi:transcriptional regulator with XRE-family HTH domain
MQNRYTKMIWDGSCASGRQLLYSQSLTQRVTANIMNMQPSYISTPAGTFSDRIKLLIQRVGSATEIARMCGFSEGVVRSWRDGNTDPSRARCVTLAKTLGISLVWLVAGEGAIQSDPSNSTPDEQYSAEVVSPQRPRPRLGTASVSILPAHDNNGVDSQRLNTAMKILQSELELADSPLTLADNTDMLADLYEILGPGGINVDTTAMLTFNHRLAKRIRQGRNAVA